MTIIYLAGAESHLDLLKDAGVKYVLVSFAYIDKVSLDKLKDFDKVFLDSGGFTYLQKYKEGKMTEEELLDKQKKYEQFVKENKDYFHAIAEFDVGTVEQRRQHRERMKEIAEGKFYPIWHIEDSKEDKLKEIVKQYQNIAIPNMQVASATKTNISNRLSKSDTLWNKVFSVCKNINVHGLAMVKLEPLKKYRFYSVDSSSWLSSSRFGAMYVFRGGVLATVHWKKASMSLIRKLAKEHKLDAEKIKKGEGKELLKLAVKEWKKYQDFWDSKTVRKNLENKVIVVGKDGRVMDVTKSRLNAFKHGLYARKLRGLTCDVCPYAEVCSEYQPGAICKFDKVWRKFGGVRDKEAVIKRIEELLEENNYRLNRALSFEDLGGGYIDKSVNEVIKLQGYLLDLLDKIKHQRPDVQIEQKSLTIQQTTNVISPELLKKYDEVMEKWKNWKLKLLKQRE